MRTPVISQRAVVSGMAILMAQILLVVLVLVIWQLSSGVVVDEMLVSSPLAILTRAEVMVAEG
jgi:hypothetical protein